MCACVYVNLHLNFGPGRTQQFALAKAKKRIRVWSISRLIMKNIGDVSSKKFRLAFNSHAISTFPFSPRTHSLSIFSSSHPPLAILPHRNSTHKCTKTWRNTTYTHSFSLSLSLWHTWVCGEQDWKKSKIALSFTLSPSSWWLWRHAGTGASINTFPLPVTSTIQCQCFEQPSVTFQLFVPSREEWRVVLIKPLNFA